MSRKNLTVVITDFLPWCSRAWTWWRFNNWIYIYLRTSQELDFCLITTSKENFIEVPSHFPANALRFPLFPIALLPKYKIVRALWLAVRSVCMRVCKHGCDVKMFCFSPPNHASTNFKKVLSSKLDKFTLFTHSFVGWNLKNLHKQAVSIFFTLKLTF